MLYKLYQPVNEIALQISEFSSIFLMLGEHILIAKEE